MKNNELYPLYLSWIKSSGMNDGAAELYKISQPSFDEFLKRYNSSEIFRTTLITNNRDIKISNLLNGTE